MCVSLCVLLSNKQSLQIQKIKGLRIYAQSGTYQCRRPLSFTHYFAPVLLFFSFLFFVVIFVLFSAFFCLFYRRSSKKTSNKNKNKQIKNKKHVKTTNILKKRIIFWVQLINHTQCILLCLIHKNFLYLQKFFLNHRA